MTEQSSMRSATTPSEDRGRRLAKVGLTLAVLCAALMILAALGARLGLWHYRTAFGVTRYACYVAPLAVFCCLIGLILGRARTQVLFPGVLGILLAIVAVYLPWSHQKLIDSHPRLRDITTDYNEPPPLNVGARQRQQQQNSTRYEHETRDQQEEAYPKVKPLIVAAPKAQAFAVTREVAQDMGLEIVEADEGEGRIEAVHTSMLYGFKDDVAMRIRETPQGTRIDIRSASRVGGADGGENAKRIETLLAKVEATLAR